MQEIAPECWSKDEEGYLICRHREPGVRERCAKRVPVACPHIALRFPTEQTLRIFYRRPMCPACVTKNEREGWEAHVTRVEEGKSRLTEPLSYEQLPAILSKDSAVCLTCPSHDSCLSWAVIE